MGAAYFYHLTRSAPEATLITLVSKSREAGWRVAVRGRNPELLSRLDEMLWLRPEDGFVPHGVAGGPFDAEQPVLLTDEAAAIPNRAACVISVAGAQVAPEEVRGMERVCILFDGRDEAALACARDQWRALTAAGCAAKYWSEASGSWRMEAEKAAAQT